MNAITVKTGCFTPLNLNTNRKYASTLLLMIAVFGLSGCVTSKRSLPLAPSPPELRFTSIYHQEPSLEMERYLVEPSTDKRKSLSDEIVRAAVDAEIMQMNEQGFNKKPDDNKLKLCGFKDRFDRKAVLAYEWDRSRLALDVDGLSFGGSDDQAIKIQYTLRLQPEKSKEQRCRFNSPWQGLIGSGYNELFAREQDTVYEELREMRAKLKNYIDQ